MVLTTYKKIYYCQRLSISKNSSINLFHKIIKLIISIRIYLNRVVIGSAVNSDVDCINFGTRSDIFEISVCWIAILPYPLYSPDLAPSNFFLFSELKKLCGVGDLTPQMISLKTWINGLQPNLQSTSMTAYKMFKKRWGKCVTLNINYIEDS